MYTINRAFIMLSPCADFEKEVTALIRQSTIRFNQNFHKSNFYSLTLILY